MSPVVVTVSCATAGVLVGWLVRHYFKVPWKPNSDTAFLLRRAGATARSGFKVYSPAVLQGTLYVMAPVTALIAMTLREWKAIPGGETEMDVKILWATCMSLAVSNWLAFVSKKWGEVEERKKAENGTKPPLG